MINFEGKVAIVTGGARDIGREVSLRLAENGAAVCINYYDNPEDASELLAVLKDKGAKAIAVQGDMTKEEDVKNVVQKCLDSFGDKIHILVNVAGGLVARKKLNEMDTDFLNFVMSLNLNTAFLMSKEVAPHMPPGSAIVNFASQAARDGGGPGAMAYSTSKGAVLTFTKGLAKELGPLGIRVNCVSPGMIATTFHDTFTKPEVREHVANITPLKREGKASEIGDLVAYLASDKSSFVTGASIEVNGGLYFV